MQVRVAAPYVVVQVDVGEFAERIQVNGHRFFGQEHRFGEFLFALNPDLGGPAFDVRTAVGKGVAHNHRHDESADVLHRDFVQVAAGTGFEARQTLGVGFAHGVAVVLGHVKIAVGRVLVHFGGAVAGFVALVANKCAVLGIGFSFALGFELRRIQCGNCCNSDLAQLLIHGFGGIKPSAPKPVEVHAAGVFHRPEKVGRRGVLEGPTGAVGFECVVKKFATHHGFAQNIECRSGLSVGVVAELKNALGIRHNGHLVQGRRAHVFHDFVGGSAARRVVDVPFLLGEVLHEGVESLVHPRPLALVAVDDHGKEVVAHLVDDDADHAELLRFRIRSVGVGAAAVKANHRVFHADVVGMDRNGALVGVVDGEFRVGLNGLRHGTGRELLPKRIPFFGVERLGEGGAVAHLDGHGVPNELAARSKGKVAHVFRRERPSFGARGLGLFAFAGFGFGSDDDGLVGGLAGFGQALALGRREHARLVGQGAGGGHEVVAGYGNGDFIVPKRKGKLALSQELLVLPSDVVAVHGHARKKLGNGVEGVALLVEVLVPAAAAVLHAVVDHVVPCDVKPYALSWGKRRRKVDPHHRVVDHVRELAAGRGLYLGHVKSALVFVDVLFVDLLGRDGRGNAPFLALVRHGTGLHHVLVQLDPQVG